MTRADFDLVAHWLAQPHVARWWNEDAGRRAVEDKYGPRVDGLLPTQMWIVELNGRAAGLIQSYRHVDYPDHDAAVGVPGAVGIDYLLSEEFAGQGHGPVVLRAFAERIFEMYPDAQWCAATPAQANRVSWRALEHAGFERRGPCQPPGEPPAYCYVLPRQGGQVAPAVFVLGEPVLSGDRDGPWKELVRGHLRGPVRNPSLTFVVSALRRRGHPFDLDNLIHPVLFVMDDPIDCVSARLYVGAPCGVLIEDVEPEPAPGTCLRTLRLDRHSEASDKTRPAIEEIAADAAYLDHEGIGLSLNFDRSDIPIKRGWYGPTEAVIDDLAPWLGRYTARGLVADHRIRDLRIIRGLDPTTTGVTIHLWYVPDTEVAGVPPAVRVKIDAAGMGDGSGDNL